MSNKFNWSTYEIPHCWTLDEQGEPTTQSSSSVEESSITIRHLKQGATGAVKTWPAAAVLLEYLVQRGGLRDVSDKIEPGDDYSSGILDLSCPPTPTETADQSEDRSVSESDESIVIKTHYNIVELGGGTGLLSLGLSLALNNEKSTARLLCTDNDRATIKNMRYNVLEQPAPMNMNKNVRIEMLDWDSDVGGKKFSLAAKSQFGSRTRRKRIDVDVPLETQDVEDDAFCLVSHLIGSDIHYGLTTLEPLSSVISAAKLRNPEIIVVLLLKERTENAVTELKDEIERKVGCGQEMKGIPALQDFGVRVRDVIHDDFEHYKMVEC